MRSEELGTLRFLFRIGLDTVKIPERSGGVAGGGGDNPCFGGTQNCDPPPSDLPSPTDPPW